MFHLSTLPMLKLHNLLFFAFFLFGITLNAHAQTLGTGFQQVQFAVGPQVPGPNERVTIEAQGVGSFIQDASITWQKDGVTVLAGKGERLFSFTTGGAGSQTKIHVVIRSATEGTFTKDFVFTPSNIQLIWEADTSAPPLYRGKTLYSAGSKIKVVALAQVVRNSSAVSPNNLSYQWSVGGEPAASASGVGRSTFSYYGNQLNQSERIGVVVRYGGAAVGSAEIILTATTPKVVLYVQDPLRGTLFDQALPPAISLVGQELTLWAQPFFFANESLGSTVSYDWTLNGQKVIGPDTQGGLLTLRQSGSGQGQSVVSLKLQNSDTYKFLQYATAQLRIVFGGQSANAPSGFGI